MTPPLTRFRALALLPLLILTLTSTVSRAADPQPGPPLTIRKATGPISVDGDLSDAGWQGIEGISQWYETNVGDNVEPQVKNLAYLTFDEKYFYAGFVFEDPNPSGIRAPFGDHDAVPGSTDYAGVIVNSRNDGKTAQMFLANVNGVQYDALSSDVSGEDSSPDYYWEAAGKITATGWSLEIRIPFSSLRYGNDATPTWGILLYRNYPRDRRYQFFTAHLPRDVNCFICNSSKITGLANLPHGSHLVLAPFATAAQSRSPSAGLGSPLESGDFETDAGLDLKWSPVASLAIDATINPDFSQVESDVAQIAANERFALSFPEKRPFFLEGSDLFSTPLSAVYTRAITSPRAGLRATGRMGATSYTALVTQDRGGGLVILPGAQGSDVALQDFISDVAVVRLRRDLGQSFVSLLVTDREVHGQTSTTSPSGGSNRVVGPDFQWRPTPSNSFTGQFLWSESQTPTRTDLAPEWDGRRLSDGAGLLSWSHGTRHEDWFLQGQTLGDDFRADDGFIPQVGYSEVFLDGGYTIRPKDAFLSRVRFFTTNWVDVDPSGEVISQQVGIGSGMDGRKNSFIRVELNGNAIRVGDQLLRRIRPRVYLQASPSRILNDLSLDTYFGDEIDFANGRKGSGVTLAASISVRPSGHVELRGNASRRWLDVDDASLGSGRLFTAQVERLRVTWTFNARTFVRLIGQYVQTERDPSLYTFTVAPKQADFSSSALFAYKFNWQTVLYAGFGDDRPYSDVSDKLEANGQQFFTKVSYAWQH